MAKIEIVPLRTAFPHEANNFTKWLAENIDALTDRLGFTLTVLEREKQVGSFIVDLVCQDDNGNRVIIENQLERTDHDHLGKLLTYMVNLEAKTAIWIVGEVRVEHERVIDWLNEVTGQEYGFYLVTLQAIRIGDSPYAPLFTLRAGPEQSLRELGAAKKEIQAGELKERHRLRVEFWEQLLERSKERTKLGMNRSPSTDHFLSISTGVSGIVYNYLIWKDSAAVEVYIDVGDKQQNKHYFDRLYSQREQIEREFGDALEWRRLDEKRARAC
ncbi:MAG: DUF4268 domain-containing protein [Candidatus Flexifilum sp.]